MVRSGVNQHSSRAHALSKLALSASSFALVAGLAATPAAAQQTAANTSQSGIETVTVTAQYVTQNVQATPLAITVVTSQDLEIRGIDNLAQLGTTVPGLTLTPAPAAYGNAVQTYIRGVGQYDTAFASEPGVGMYVDDFYYGTMTGSELSLLDLKDVEIDKGPQGVLGGKNDIGGAIRLYTQQPLDDNSGYISATYGAFDDVEVRGAANLTVIPGHLFVRFSAAGREQEGYVTEIDYACAFGPGTGPTGAGSIPVTTQNNGCKIGTQGGFNTAGGRAAIRWVYDAHLQDNFAVNVLQDNSPLTPDVLYAVDASTQPNGPVYYNNGNGVQAVPRNTFIGAALGGAANVPGSSIPVWNAVYNMPHFGVPFDQRFIPTGSNIFNTTYANYTDEEGQVYNDGEMMHSWGMSNILDYDLPWWDIHFKSITGYRFYQGAYSNDQGVSPLDFELTTTFPSDREFQQEERFTGKLFNDRLEWTAGVFYYNRTNRAQGPVTLDADYDLGIHALVFEQDDTYEAENTSGYLYGIYHIWDNWEILGGWRYTSESKTYYFDHLGSVPGYAGSGFFRDTLIAAQNPNNPADQLCNYAVMPQCPADAALYPNTVTTQRPDYRAGTDYHITDDLMAYFTWSTGYRSVGFNSRPFDPFQLQPGNGAKYGPEEIASYEIGAKTQFFDDRLQFDISAYNADYTHTITPESRIDPSGLPWVYYTNAGASTNRGLELETQAAPIDNLLLKASYSYVNVSVSAAPGAQPGFLNGCTAAAVASHVPGCAQTAPGTVVVGSAPILFPAQTLQLSGQYTWKFSLGQITPRLEWDWQSVIYQDANNDPYTEIPARGLLNGSLTWDAPDNGWQIQLLVNNIADKHYFLSMFDLTTFGEGTIEAQPGTPREWFITLKKTF